MKRLLIIMFDGNDQDNTDRMCDEGWSFESYEKTPNGFYLVTYKKEVVSETLKEIPVKIEVGPPTEPTAKIGMEPPVREVTELKEAAPCISRFEVARKKYAQAMAMSCNDLRRKSTRDGAHRSSNYPKEALGYAVSLREYDQEFGRRFIAKSTEDFPHKYGYNQIVSGVSKLLKWDSVGRLKEVKVIKKNLTLNDKIEDLCRNKGPALLKAASADGITCASWYKKDVVAYAIIFKPLGKVALRDNLQDKVTKDSTLTEYCTEIWGKVNKVLGWAASVYRPEFLGGGKPGYRAGKLKKVRSKKSDTVDTSKLTWDKNKPAKRKADVAMQNKIVEHLPAAQTLEVVSLSADVCHWEICLSARLFKENRKATFNCVENDPEVHSKLKSRIIDIIKIGGNLITFKTTPEPIGISEYLHSDMAPKNIDLMYPDFMGTISNKVLAILPTIERSVRSGGLLIITTMKARGGKKIKEMLLQKAHNISSGNSLLEDPNSLVGKAFRQYGPNSSGYAKIAGVSGLMSEIAAEHDRIITLLHYHEYKEKRTPEIQILLRVDDA